MKKFNVLSVFLGSIIIAGSLTLFEYYFASVYLSHDRMNALSVLLENSVNSLPVGYYMILIFFNLLVAFIAGTLPVIIGNEELEYSLIIGVIATAFAILNNYFIPFPVWYKVTSLLIFIPMSYLGGWFLKRIFMRILFTFNFHKETK